ncbi:MAG: hypothetical protein JNK90_12585 [Planctomycetaceae bacterium]|nr:hypothetical protein [Planctomycetaceae bacterium]MBN8599917.1 hypothetical protein [Planctomycetota bacterium]
MKRVHYSRRELLGLASGVVVCGALTLALTPFRRITAQEPTSRNLAETGSGRGIVDFEVQLSRGLRTFLPQQKAFVSSVVLLVQQGKISRAMVNTVYTWSLQRNPSVPFPYFEFAMRALARRRGVTIT